MTLKGLFSENPNIIINTDIDGFLSGMLLQKYYGCKVVGFSNSRETVWVSSEVKSIYDPIYIDLYVNHPDVICIEQHIIAFDKKHHEKIKATCSKMNPNLDRERTFLGDMQSDYYHKYPFGTCHYLAYLMAKEGINVDFGNLSTKYAFIIKGKKHVTTAGQVLLRADDALYSTQGPYRDNALDWWHWLDPSKKIPAIQCMVQYINSLDIERADECKRIIGYFFKALGCDGIDGAFKDITDDQGNMLVKVNNYNSVICRIMGMDLTLPQKYKIYKGDYNIDHRCAGSNMSILNSENLFSYAFVFSPKSQKPNFSYTLDTKLVK